MLRDPQRVLRRADTGFLADPSDVLNKTNQGARLLGFEGGSYRTGRLNRPQDRTGSDRLLQHRRVDHLARRAAGPFREPLAEPPNLAGILDQREPGAHGRYLAERYIRG